MAEKKKNKVSRSALQFLAKRIASTLPVQKIILFGSYAYGKPGPDSDVDLFVIMKSTKRPTERVGDIWDKIYPAPFPLDIIARTPKEVQRRLKLGDFFVEEILQKGKTLYVNHNR